MARASGHQISQTKPIVGANVFRHESGIHCSGLLKNKSSYQLFDPKQVGQKECEFVIGYHSGSSAIIHVLRQQGINISRKNAKSLLSVVRQKTLKQKTALIPEQLKELYLIS
ncbi:MAG: hypothetical protein ABIJ59_17965 [Pseudomonadota bacterium]